MFAALEHLEEACELGGVLCFETSPTGYAFHFQIIGGDDDLTGLLDAFGKQGEACAYGTNGFTYDCTSGKFNGVFSPAELVPYKSGCFSGFAKVTTFFLGLA